MLEIKSTHNIILNVNGKTYSMQGDLKSGKSAMIKLPNEELSLGQQKALMMLSKCIGTTGKEFGMPINSLHIDPIT